MAQKDIVQYQFSKGVSGNPNGRPLKEFSITEGIREFLAEDDPDKRKARKDIIVEKVVSMALRGDKEMIKYVIDRLEGTPKGESTNLNLQINQTPLTDDQRASYAYEVLARVHKISVEEVRKRLG